MITLGKLKLECTGEIDRTVGMIIHDGDSCPIHESLEGYRTEIRDESNVPVRHITLDVLHAEAAIAEATGLRRESNV
jgi:hypothetical protein